MTVLNTAPTNKQYIQELTCIHKKCMVKADTCLMRIVLTSHSKYKLVLPFAVTYVFIIMYSTNRFKKECIYSL